MKAVEHFETLPTPSTMESFSIGAELCPSCRIGRSHEGYPALLIAVKHEDKSMPRRLENLKYDPPRTLKVLSPGHAERAEELAVLQCQSFDLSLQATFFRIAESLLNIGATLDEAVLEERLDELVDLFRALNRPGERTVQGLWAELAFVCWSKDPVTTVSSWHSSPHALHDFVGGVNRIEIKSCATGLREHLILLDQLIEAPEGSTLIVSLIVQDRDDGSTIADLVDEILARTANTETKRRLERIVTQSLGRSWRDAATRRFDLDAARKELRLYSAAIVPCVPQPIPPEVKAVEFVVDLSTTPDTTLAAARALGTFFQRLLPADDA